MTGKKREILFFIVLLLCLSFLFLFNIAKGSVEIGWREVCRALFFQSGEETTLRIITQIRLPRTIAAILLGGALSVSGYLLQTFFNNPIVGPYVLGISSGAKLCVALLLMHTAKTLSMVTSAQMVLAAFVGAMISMGFVLLIANHVRSQAILVICGIMIGYLCSAITEFVITFSDDSDIVNLHNWSQGSFSGISRENVMVIFFVIVPAVVLTFLLSKPIGAYLLGEDYARSMGVRILLLRIALLLLSSLLSATVTAFAGPISFVGIAVPHVAKRILKTNKPILMIPSCFFTGAVFCLFCDYLARNLFAPIEISISSVTAVFGAPIVLSVMLRKKRGSQDE